MKRLTKQIMKELDNEYVSMVRYLSLSYTVISELRARNYRVTAEEHSVIGSDFIWKSWLIQKEVE